MRKPGSLPLLSTHLSFVLLLLSCHNHASLSSSSHSHLQHNSCHFSEMKNYVYYFKKINQHKMIGKFAWAIPCSQNTVDPRPSSTIIVDSTLLQMPLIIPVHHILNSFLLWKNVQDNLQLS